MGLLADTKAALSRLLERRRTIAVLSFTKDDVSYDVVYGKRDVYSCTCPHHTKAGAFCKHMREIQARLLAGLLPN